MFNFQMKVKFSPVTEDKFKMNAHNPNHYSDN